MKLTTLVLQESEFVLLLAAIRERSENHFERYIQPSSFNKVEFTKADA